MQTRTRTLNDLMDFDHVIRVLRDGSVVDAGPDVYAPNCHDGELDSREWSLMTGYTGQYGYSGPCMHASEVIGGGMERDILSRPGLYVALVDYPLDDSEPEGWVVAYILDPEVFPHEWASDPLRCSVCGLSPQDPTEYHSDCKGAPVDPCPWYLMPGMRCDGERNHTCRCFKNEV